MGDGILMKGVLYYFSGTGNTKWVADRFKENFKSYGIDIKLVNIESEESINIKCYDFIVVGSVVHSNMEPKIVSDFLKKLPNTKKKMKTIIYSTQGGKSSVAVLSMAKKISQKGYDIVIQSAIRMPNNCYFISGKKTTKKEENEILKNASEKVKELIKIFIDNKRLKENNSIFKMGIGKISSKLFKNSLPKLSKNLTAIEECKKCGLCLRNCPKNNITFEDGHAVFHSKCMLCLRCMNICPINGIRYKNKKIEQVQRDRINVLNLNK